MTAGSAKLPLSLSDREAVGFGSTFADCNRWLGKVGLPYFEWKMSEYEGVIAGRPSIDDSIFLAVDTRHRLARFGETVTLEASLTRGRKT